MDSQRKTFLDLAQQIKATGQDYKGNLAQLAELARQEREIQRQMLQVLLQIKVVMETDAKNGTPKVAPRQLQTFAGLLEECSLVLHSQAATRVSIALALVSAMSQLESFQLDT